jgi:hypothetical protein
VINVTRTHDYWMLATRAFFVSFSIRLDWNDYPGLSISFGLFTYHIGLSMVNHVTHECKATA